MSDLRVEPLVARFEHACALQSAGQLAAAREAYEALLQDAPAGHVVQGPGWANLGAVLDSLGDRPAARHAHEQALAADPSLPAAHLHLGQWWMDARDDDAPARAEHHLQHAARLMPGATHPWTSLGALLGCLRRDADAEACLRQALQIDPANVAARFNLAYLTLRQGRFDEGWACLESRPSNAPLAARVPWPRWAGEPLDGRHLIIVCDAGHGDLLQLWRYRPWLHARGARTVSWLVLPALVPLLRAQRGVGPVYALGEVPPLEGPDAPEVWAPLMSLPWLCGPDPVSGQPWPDALPYVTVPPVPPAAQPMSSGDRPFTIGLVWHGNPSHENDAERSLPGVRALAPLAEAIAPAVQAGRVRVLDLQPEGGADAREPWPGLQAAPAFHDFTDVARTMQGLDLLITVDTAYAHLAGALGRPVWVMLPHWKTDWRWLDERSDSPWYPGVMRLFRQPARGQWGPVIAEVAQALRCHLLSAQALTPSPLQPA